MTGKNIYIVSFSVTSPKGRQYIQSYEVTADSPELGLVEAKKHLQSFIDNGGKNDGLYKMRYIETVSERIAEIQKYPLD